jgi:exonuclease SbcC
MLLKVLHLEKIRSYANAKPIHFPLGTTLFEGDIGSGKSTILYAIEFALFGLGEFRGNFLLRNGATKGSVTLTFEQDGNEYEVQRTLVKKGKGVQQGECYLKTPSGKQLLSPSELKERVLQVLKFNEPANPRAQSLIYRYAIFTPQEEMKEVILKDPDDRLQTLRKAFRIEDYKIAAQNSGVLMSEIKGRIEYLKGVTADIEDKRNKLNEAINQIEKFSGQLTPLLAEEARLKSEKKAKDEELQKLQKQREKIKEAEGRVPLLKNQINDKNEQIKSSTGKIEKFQKKMRGEIEPQISGLQKMKKPTDTTEQELKKELEVIKKELNEITKQQSKLEERIENIEKVVQEKTCPVCERPVDSGEFGSKKRHLGEELEKVERKIEKLNKQREENDDLIQKLKDYARAEKDLNELKRQLKESQDEIDEHDHLIKRLQNEIDDLQSKLRNAEEEAKPLQTVLTRIEELGEELESLQGRSNRITQQIATINANIQRSETEKEVLGKEISEKEEQLELKRELDEHKFWLDEYFAPTLENIEKHVMAAINERFNKQFQRWFSILIEEPELQVRVDEDFSPIIEREGYEQQYVALSGGERTSIALAYRLALNTIVQEVATGNSSNLLILDEPTDGFSREQLFKIREILNELRCPQVVIVSHESELEGFADHVFKVEKKNGLSTIMPLSK